MLIIFNIFLIFLVMIFSSLPLILAFEYFIRPIYAKKLAKEFRLKYKLNNGFITLGLDSTKDNDFSRNILEGKINGHSIKIYDIASGSGRKFYILKNLEGRIIYGTRFTVLIIDKRKYGLQGKISGYYSISGIRKYLLTVLNKKNLS